MLSREMMGWGAILVGILIAATMLMGLPSELNYLWAVLALAWGAMTLWGKKR